MDFESKLCLLRRRKIIVLSFEREHRTCYNLVHTCKSDSRMGQTQTDPECNGKDVIGRCFSAQCYVVKYYAC